MEVLGCFLGHPAQAQAKKTVAALGKMARTYNEAMRNPLMVSCAPGRLLMISMPSSAGPHNSALISLAPQDLSLSKQHLLRSRHFYIHKSQYLPPIRCFLVPRSLIEVTTS